MTNVPYLKLEEKMTTALIFAGGTGKRMNSRSKPKQFLEMHGKPIIIYTLEHFEYHEGIDAIVVVCIQEWIKELEGLLKRFGISKVKKIVPGGETGHDSIYLGLTAMKNFSKTDDVVLIHDGVRPLITGELITRNIETTRDLGNAITVETVRESVIRSIDGSHIYEVPRREEMYIAKAPQSFLFGRILHLYEMAGADGIKSIDSAQLCSLYKVPMNMVASTGNNLKITEPGDYYIYRALYEAVEGQQIFGL